MVELEKLGDYATLLQNEAIRFERGNGYVPLSHIKPFEMSAADITVDGENWLKKLIAGKDEPYRPSDTSAIIIAEMEGDNLSKVAIVDTKKGSPIALADKAGAYIYEGGDVYPIHGVIDSNLTGEQIQTFLFGQKGDHWAPMNYINAGLADKGYRSTNDMSSVFIPRKYLNFHVIEGDRAKIMPQRAILMEPYAVKGRQEKGAFFINSMNKGLPEKERFVLNTISGESLYPESESHQRIKEGTLCPVYCGRGYVISPDAKTYETFMRDLAEIVTDSNFINDLNKKGLLGKETSSSKKVNLFLRDIEAYGATRENRGM
jgi:hypothetical protein